MYLVGQRPVPGPAHLGQRGRGELSEGIFRKQFLFQIYLVGLAAVTSQNSLSSTIGCRARVWWIPVEVSSQQKKPCHCPSYSLHLEVFLPAPDKPIYSLGVKCHTLFCESFPVTKESKMSMSGLSGLHFQDLNSASMCPPCASVSLSVKWG